MATTTISRTTFTDNNGTPGTGDVWGSTLINSSIYDPIDAILSGNVELGGDLTLVDTKNLYIGDSANGSMTTGLTINQGAADNEILALKSSDVAHGMTGVTETDTYLFAKKFDATLGGLDLVGIRASTVGVRVYDNVTTEDPTRTTGAVAPVQIAAAVKSGTGRSTMAADKNLLTVGNATVVRFILDSDGDSHQDVGTAWTNFDDHDDVALLTALSAGVSRPGDPVREQFAEVLEAHRETLEQAKIVTFNPDGHHFVNWSRLKMVLVGAVRQQAQQIADQAQQIAELTSTVKQIAEAR